MICLGTRVAIDLADGSPIDPPASYGMLYDGSGKEFSRSALLIGPFERGKKTNQKIPHDARAWLGRSHVVHEGSCKLPPRSLSSWKKIGEIGTLGDRQGTIWYTRGGTKAPGRFKHRFNKASLIRLIKGKGRVVLYEYVSWLRIELPRGAIVDDRGIVSP